MCFMRIDKNNFKTHYISLPFWWIFGSITWVFLIRKGTWNDLVDLLIPLLVYYFFISLWDYYKRKSDD